MKVDRPPDPMRDLGEHYYFLLPFPQVNEPPVIVPWFDKTDHSSATRKLAVESDSVSALVLHCLF